ncbi:MAG: hypothetical protein Q9180_009541, partial [Flavoplaca navasiana]
MQLSLATLLSILAATASCRGINCEGNSECYRAGDTAASRLIHAGPDDRRFNNKQQIARVPAGSGPNPDSANCAYLQDIERAPLRRIEGLASRIIEHGCKDCGSLPNFFPADNNVAK